MQGSEEEVRKSVAGILEAMKRTGYILSPAHNLQGDVKPENVIQIYKAAKDYFSAGK